MKKNSYTQSDSEMLITEEWKMEKASLLTDIARKNEEIAKLKNELACDRNLHSPEFLAKYNMTYRHCECKKCGAQFPVLVKGDPDLIRKAFLNKVVDVIRENADDGDHDLECYVWELIQKLESLVKDNRWTCKEML